jgi:membrane protease YdiL (CAAX protease family)
VDDTINQLTSPQTGAPAAPAFAGPRWSGWKLAAIAVAGILAFFLAQMVLLAVVFDETYPHMVRFLMRYGVLPADATSNQALINMLTAKNLLINSLPSEVVLALVTIGLARAVLGIAPGKLGLGKLPSLAQFGIAIAGGLGLVVATDIVGELQNVVLGPQPPQLQALILLSHHGFGQFVLDFISVSIAAPFGEETFFRGLLFTGLAQRTPLWFAACISAALFSGAHFEKLQVLPIFIVGLGLAWVYYKTKSLWASMAAHATFNGVSLIFAYFLPQLVK